MLDNEPDLWGDVHFDIYPTPLGYDGYWNSTVTHAKAIKVELVVSTVDLSSAR